MARLWVSALLVVTCVSLASAQNSIRIRFEVYRNGALVGNPEVSATAGTAVSLTMDGIGRIAFTPASRDTDSVSLTFDIDSGDRHVHPRLVLRANDPGSVSWKSTDGREAFKFTVTWLR